MAGILELAGLIQFCAFLYIRTPLDHYYCHSYSQLQLSSLADILWGSQLCGQHVWSHPFPAWSLSTSTRDWNTQTQSRKNTGKTPGREGTLPEERGMRRYVKSLWKRRKIEDSTAVGIFSNSRKNKLHEKPSQEYNEHVGRTVNCNNKTLFRKHKSRK